MLVRDTREAKWTKIDNTGRGVYTRGERGHSPLMTHSAPRRIFGGASRLASSSSSATFLSYPARLDHASLTIKQRRSVLSNVSSKAWIVQWAAILQGEYQVLLIRVRALRKDRETESRQGVEMPLNCPRNVLELGIFMQVQKGSYQCSIIARRPSNYVLGTKRCVPTVLPACIAGHKVGSVRRDRTYYTYKNVAWQQVLYLACPSQ